MNLSEILEEYGVESRAPGEHHHATSGWLNVDCPFCSPGSGRFRLGLPLDGFTASCWVCGKHPVPEVLKELLGIPWGEAKDLLGGFRDLIVRGERPAGKLRPPADIGPLLRPHRDYLRGRGFDPDTLEKLWGVRGIGLSKRLSWRLYLPVTEKGKVVSWTTRSLVSEGTRYVSARPEEEARPLKSTLYGADFVGHTAVVCEGLFDAIRVGPGAVATFGVRYTAAQVYKLAKYPTRVIVFDNEPEAQRQAEKLRAELEPLPGRTVRVELDAKDPGSAGDKEIRLLRKSFLE